MKWHWEKRVEAPTTLAAFISEHCNLSVTTIKKVLQAGGGWIKQGGGGKPKRCRKAKYALQTGDSVSFYYDAQAIQPVAAPEAILQTPHWGIWYKPAALLAQGSPYGDQGAMDRQVQIISGKSQVFLIHRLDREAAGLMALAYTRQAAAKLSALWQSAEVKKVYQAEAKGTLTEDAGAVTEPLDGKPAETRYRVHLRRGSSTLLEIEITSGRLHQIRRHLEAIGHPLLGDPRYGKNNGDPRGLQLVASDLHFTCPITSRAICCSLPSQYRLFARPPPTPETDV